LTYDTNADKIYKKVSAGSNVAVPNYVTSDITVTCPSNIFFNYYKKDGSAWTAGGTDTYNIGRVEMTYTVNTGSGVFGEGQASVTVTTASDVKQYI